MEVQKSPPTFAAMTRNATDLLGLFRSYPEFYEIPRLSKSNDGMNINMSCDGVGMGNISQASAITSSRIERNYSTEFSSYPSSYADTFSTSSQTYYVHRTLTNYNSYSHISY